MPSVITKPQENGAPQVQETSIQAAIAIVEKKVRNLEKRKVCRESKIWPPPSRGKMPADSQWSIVPFIKYFFFFQGKLDSYRDILKRGKALNEDQQSAVDKYDEVGVGVITLHHATLVGLPVYFLHFIF